jgi:hypothetical protein
MTYTGPFTFNAVRFGLGALSLLPLILVLDRKAGQSSRKNRSYFILWFVFTANRTRLHNGRKGSLHNGLIHCHCAISRPVLEAAP